MRKRPARNKFLGQTLIEMLMALGAGVLIVMAIIGGVVVANRNSQFSKNQNLATRYAQEGIELIRSQRDQLGWNAFYSAYNNVPQCIDGSAKFTNMAGSCGQNVASFFSRSATFFDTNGSGKSLTVTVTVSWSEVNGSHDSKQTTLLTEWE
ncbi:MAG: hypothetical protein M1120_03905 [Patescibacteria group bacterium]|nr:hypothetical protein [Patescibacteria group bacterium]